MLASSLIACVLTASVQSAGATPSTLLRSVRVEPANANAATVVIEGDGPLPSPNLGVVDGPPRIFLDFTNVRPGTRGATSSEHPAIRRVRVALYQSEPAITRVVIDLKEPLAHALDTRQSAAGIVRLTMSPAGETQSTPARTATQTTAPTVPVRRPGDAAGNRSLRDLEHAVSELEQLRPVLSSIDTRTHVAPLSLETAMAEFDALRQELATSHESQARDLLMRVCTLGTIAARRRLEAQQQNDQAVAMNAASAAAGAIVLLDRARAELKSPL